MKAEAGANVKSLEARAATSASSTPEMLDRGASRAHVGLRRRSRNGAMRRAHIAAATVAVVAARC